MDDKTDLEQFRIGAEQLKITYDEFVKAGFSKKEAFELIKEIINGTVNKVK